MKEGMNTSRLWGGMAEPRDLGWEPPAGPAAAGCGGG